MTSIEAAESLREHVLGFGQRRVLVIGDAILDEYLHGDTGRISPEAPVPVLRVVRSRRVLGGAANTAANVVSLGAHATLIALVGQDEGGAALRERATEAGVDLRAVDSGAPTLRKTRVVSQQQQMIRLDYEDPKPMTSAVAEAVLAAFDAAVTHADIVVMSDYAKGVLSERMSQNIITRAHKAGRDVIVDPRPQNRACYAGCDYMTPNWKEARALLRLPDVEPTPDRVAETARALASEMNANIVLTLGAGGIMFCSRDGREMFSQPTMAREVFDVSGAGDTVVAAFALARSSRIDHPTAVTLANRAASVVVGKFGTATVTPEEILDTSDASRLISRQGLAPLAARLRSRGRKIVTINGSFDLLHGGHLYILSEAKKCGDVLIVGLNSDRSVRGYKGPTRPIVPEHARADMLLALRVVDYVHIFDEPDPIAFLREVKPDVHVNGAEYGEDCIEAETVKENGGVIQLVSRIPGLSTSGLVDAIQTSRT
jgi:D-beta-D-heptose 7-phosphate kinase / D-beta-D-heptose 1-phosphate adenosyltransferase